MAIVVLNKQGKEARKNGTIVFGEIIDENGKWFKIHSDSRMFSKKKFKYKKIHKTKPSYL